MKKNLLTRTVSMVIAFSLAVIGLTGCESPNNGGAAAGIVSNVANNNTAANNDNGGGTDDNGSSAEKLVVTVAAMPTLTFEWTSKLAYLKGFYEEEFSHDNIEINYIDVGLGPAVNEAFLAGEIDIGIYGDFPILTGSANGTDVTLISSSIFTQKGIGLVVSADSDITDIAQLKGQKVTVPLGTTNHQQLIRYLNSAGVSIDDVELVNCSNVADGLTSVYAGEVSALAYGDPGMTVEENNGNLRVLTVATDENKAQNSLYIAASNKFLSEHGDVASRYLKTLNRAYEWYNESDENKQEAYKLLADFSGTDEEQIPLWIDHFDASLHLTQDDIERTRTTYQFLQDNDLIGGEVDIEGLFNDSYLKQALE